MSVSGILPTGDYVKVNSPPDSLLEDDGDCNAFEMREMNRPAPPKTLALNSSTAFNSYASEVTRSSKTTPRAASAGRAPSSAGFSSRVDHAPQQVKECAVYLLGGSERDGSATVFKKPMTVWKLTMFFRNVAH